MTSAGCQWTIIGRRMKERCVSFIDSDFYVFTLLRLNTHTQPPASDHTQPGANLTAKLQHLNINRDTGTAQDYMSACVTECVCVCANECVRGRELHGGAELRTRKMAFPARLTSGTFLLNSRLSSTRCLWECSLSSCRPASSDATELSSLCTHKESHNVRGGT